MDIIDVIMYRLGRYDTKIDAMYGVWQLLEGDNKILFGEVVSRYMNDAIDAFVPDEPDQDEEFIASFPEVSETVRTLKMANTPYYMLGVEMIAYAMALTKTSWGMAPWEALTKAVRQYEDYHLDVA